MYATVRCMSQCPHLHQLSSSSAGGRVNTFSLFLQHSKFKLTVILSYVDTSPVTLFPKLSYKIK